MMLLERHHSDRFRVYASAAMSDFPQTRDIAKDRLRKVEILDQKKAIAKVNGLSLDYSWLKGASETYQISPDIKDYILTSVPIVTVDFPNRNLHSFSFDETSYFDPRFGQFIYKTFVGKPTFADHNNKIFTEAKGVHFDSTLKYVPGWDVWKIHVLIGYDRTKDSSLARQIERGTRRSYSMGSWVSYFLNSITGQLSNGSQPLKYPKGTVHNGLLSYDLCSGCEYFECLVNTPVRCIDGTAMLKDLQVRDTVYDEFGKPIKVKQVFHNGKKPVVDLISTGKVVASCTLEHRWLVKQFDGLSLVKKVSDFLPGDKIVTILEGNQTEMPIVVGSILREEDTFDIHVDSDTNLYMLANGMITHNTSSVVGPADVTAESHQLWMF